MPFDRVKRKGRRGEPTGPSMRREKSPLATVLQPAITRGIPTGPGRNSPGGFRKKAMSRKTREAY